MELGLQIIGLLIVAGSAVVTALAAPDNKWWRIPLTIFFSAVGLIGMILMIASYRHKDAKSEGEQKTTGECSPIIGGHENNTSLNCSKTYAPPQRHLSEEESKALKDAASEGCISHRRIRVTASNSDKEAQIYAYDFISALRAAGCQADLELPIPGLEANATGVIIGIRPWIAKLEDLKSTNPDAYFVAKTLTTANIYFVAHPLTKNFFQDSTYVLAIGGDAPNATH